ncbi:MAG TPA: DUF3786 domain-containing protein [Thermodesulfobacteriota bacterium]|nr:DUF3786 domain-containing protein [Thermodesulfobacteriota bacterium]
MGQNEKDAHETHTAYWERLARANPDEVCRRAGAAYDPRKEGYNLRVLNRNYLVLPAEKKILCAEGERCFEEALRDHFYLMALLYLLNSREGEPAATWIGEKDLKGGATFFRGPHALRTEELKKRFGKDPEEFAKAGKRLGGVELLFGDKAFALQVLPKVPIAYVLWKEDSEFPAEVKVMFDSTIQNHFSLDGIWCLVAEVSERLLETAGR